MNMFIDITDIFLKSGDGGDGQFHFRRESISLMVDLTVAMVEKVEM